MSNSPDNSLRDWIDPIIHPTDSIGFVIRDTLTTVTVVLAVALVLFAVSGLWPPLVAVESGSMQPNMEKGDLVFIVDEHRYSSEKSHEGVVTNELATEHNIPNQFGQPGDVIVYTPNGVEVVEVIHRAMFWVSEGENWYPRADKTHLQADSCDGLRACPAPHGGFVTLGDGNQYYDQSNRMSVSSPVRPSWVQGKARGRVPYLGWPRLVLTGKS